MPPEWQPFPDWSMIAPRGKTAGVPAAVVLTANTSSPVLRTPEGFASPGVSSPAVAAGLVPQRRGRRVGPSATRAHRQLLAQGRTAGISAVAWPARRWHESTTAPQREGAIMRERRCTVADSLPPLVRVPSAVLIEHPGHCGRDSAVPHGWFCRAWAVLSRVGDVAIVRG